MTERLEGKAALVTGATSGIGLAIAERFAAEGAKLLLTGRNEKSGTDLARRLGADLVERTVARFGRIDILINNAGVEHRGSALETSDDDFARVMAVNVEA